MKRLAAISVLALTLVSACMNAAPSATPRPSATPVASAGAPSVRPSGSPASSLVPSASPAGSLDPLAERTAKNADGPFTLAFTLPRTTWKAGEAITGESALRLTEGAVVTLTGSGGGLLFFAFAEVDGEGRSMGPAATANCRPYELEAAEPMTSPITKSGGYSAEDPHAAFYMAFFQGADVNLPAGTWDITASAHFTEGSDCTGTNRSPEATIRITVTE